jgi:uncharacterized protein (TIGR03790 family)
MPVVRNRFLPSAAAALLCFVAVLVCGVCGARTRPLRSEVLIVVNGQSPVSVAIGAYYQQKRNVPAANVVTLSVPLADPNLGNSVQEFVTTQATFDAQIRTPIQTFLTANGLVDQIEIIVVAAGVPHRFTPSATTPSACLLSNPNYLRDCTRASVDAELATLSQTPGAGGIGQNGEQRNPYFDSDEPFRTWRTANPSAPLKYLVARLAGFQTPIDAATGVPVDVKALIDGAIATNAAPGNILVDQNPTIAAGLRTGNTLWLSPVAALMNALGANVQHDTANTFVSNATKLVGYASWGSNDNHDAGAPFYGTIGGNTYPGTFQARSIATDLVSTSARTFTTGANYDQSLSADLVRLGAAGVAGSAFEPLATGLSRAPILFRNYFTGARAIEAFYRSVPYLSWMNVWIGDPLMVAQAPAFLGDDIDGDGVPNASDNCLDLPNANQRDTDGDGYGNLCDADLNGDGIVKTSWGVTTPPSARGDLENIQITAGSGGYVSHQDLDGDSDVDADDVGIAQYWLFLPPGRSGLHP